jgi:peroxiredoxin family protein
MQEVVTNPTESTMSLMDRTDGERKLKRLAIVVRDEAYDRLYTPLTFAYVAATKGVEVDILFVLWAVRVLTEHGAKSVNISPQHASEAEWFRERIRRDGDPTTINDFMKQLKRTGHVHFYGCRLAAATFDVRESQLIDEADGIVDAMWFLEKKAAQADHCQYF